VRPAVGSQRDRLAIENDFASRQLLYEPRNLRNRGGHIVEAARIDMNRVAALVNLDARTIHLPLEHDIFAQLLQRFANIGRRLRQHGRDRR
jgi:hypothetical protein